MDIMQVYETCVPGSSPGKVANISLSENMNGCEIYMRYLEKVETLALYQDYAKNVMHATNGASKTPVQPLATMGRNGGPLLCDLCKKPMILEGGKYDRVYADDAWRQNPDPNWVSYISGGMVILIESNKTLRVYHGYPQSGCAQVSSQHDDAARSEFRSNQDKEHVRASYDAVLQYLKDTNPGIDHEAHMREVNRIMFNFDPGLGVNFW